MVIKILFDKYYLLNSVLPQQVKIISNEFDIIMNIALKMSLWFIALGKSKPIHNICITYSTRLGRVVIDYSRLCKTFVKV